MVAQIHTGTSNDPATLVQSPFKISNYFATLADAVLFIASQSVGYRLLDAMISYEVAGSGGSVGTLVKCGQAESPGEGDVMTATPLDLTQTAATAYYFSLSSTEALQRLAEYDRIYIDPTGVPPTGVTIVLTLIPLNHRNYAVDN